LTLLAPDIVKAILDGRQPCVLALPASLGRLPSLWDEQRSRMAETTARFGDRPILVVELQ
jgi:hypothetical protein